MISLATEGMSLAYEIGFRGAMYLISGYSSKDSVSLLTSFKFEEAIRDRWWDVRPREVVIDVGAAFGSYTLPALAAGAKRVIAIEPHRDDFFDLCTHLSLNGFWPRCSAYNLLVGENMDLMGTTDSYYPDSHSYRPEGSPESRFVTSLDQIVGAEGLERLDWIKIDVDGSEIEVLKGSMASLKRFRPKLIVENHIGIVPGIDEEVRGLLRGLGYSREDKARANGVNDCWSRWEY